jgi:hypothetical protein
MTDCSQLTCTNVPFLFQIVSLLRRADYFSAHLPPLHESHTDVFVSAELAGNFVMRAGGWDPRELKKTVRDAVVGAAVDAAADDPPVTFATNMKSSVCLCPSA